MRFLLLVIAGAICAICVVAGCGSSESAGAKVDLGAPAGDVRELAGSVTATRDGTRRGLAVGDVVLAGELIETGADGDVVIELRHNHVRWHLGSAQARKPIDAAAWTASAPTEPVGPSGDRTAAAGRLAEREAADTAAGAVARDEEERSVAGGGGEKGDGKPRQQAELDKPNDRPTEDRRPDERRDEADREDPPADKAAREVRTKATGSPESFDKDDDRGGGGGGGEVPDTLDSEAVAAVMSGIEAKLRTCGETHPGTAEVSVQVEVRPDGTVSSVTAVSDVPADLLGCLRGVVETARFPRAVRDSRFSYPLTF